jgi:CBS domain-containing protein
MSAPAETLPSDLSFRDVAARFHGGRAGYPVTEEGRLVGYCGREELYSAMSRTLPLDTPLKIFMRGEPPTVRPEQTLLDAAHAFLGKRVEVLAVVSGDEGSKVVGVLSPLDVFWRAVTAIERQPEPGRARGQHSDE